MLSVENTLAIFILLIHILHKVESTGDPPQFTNPSSATSETLTEDADTSTYIFIVVAIDNEGNALTYSVHNQTPSSPSFTFDPASRKLYPPTGLDAETTTSFDIVFSVTDGTSTEDSPVLTVNIQDVNEHSPDFNQTSYTASIYDTASNGDVILTVFATDLDVTSSLTYSITGGDSTTFSIGSSSGAVSVATASNLNAASTPSYTLTVQVSDTSTTDTASVIITVLVSDDPCTPNPCKNSGSYSRSGTSYTCTCQTGWIGTTGTDVSSATLVGAVISAFVVGFLFGVFLRHFYQRLKRTVTGHNTQDQRQQIQSQETDINVVNLPTNTYEQLRNRTVTESRMTYDSLNVNHNMRI